VSPLLIRRGIEWLTSTVPLLSSIEAKESVEVVVAPVGQVIHLPWIFIDIKDL